MTLMNKILRNFFVAALAIMSASAMAQTTVTFDTSADKGSCDASNAGADQVTKGGVTIAISNGAMKLDNQYRCYKAATFSVTSTVGNITKVEITCSAEGTEKYGPGCFTDATAGTYAFEGKVGTWTGEAASFSVTATSAQVRISTVIVTIAASTEPTTPSGGDGNDYTAIVDGKLAPEFAAVAGEDGGVANNAADGKSIITITAGKATVTAVGGTTPANNAEGGGQQITVGDVIDAENHIYKVASIEAWNDIKWEKKNQGDIDFWYITGTGNPYVGMNAKENKKDEEWQGNYQADYVYYEPDGSAGLPVTGLYYKFTASTKGAFKVKVWANKGNRKTFVVNAKTMKAERLLASGYINGVNDEAGKKKLLTVEQVDSVHHVYIYGNYEAALEKGKGEDQTQEDFDAKMAEMKAEADKNAIDRQYVIGNGNQNFWGWLTFDVEEGEEYWVFQHSSQIGFGGFEFHEGKTADELISGIEAAYVYTTNFSTYENEEGERVTWKGEKAVGDSQFAQTEEEGAPFGDYFQNVIGSAPRQNYCLLPEDVLAHSSKTHELTIAFWVSAEGFTPDQYTYAPFFTAYAQQNAANTWPMLALQSRGPIQVNCSGWCDFTGANAVGGKVNIYNVNAWEAANADYNNAGNWLEDQKWHYYTAVFTDTNAKVYLDGEVKNEWNVDGTSEGQVISGLFTNGNELKYVCLGGNQAWDWADLDSPFKFARLLIKNSGMSAGEIKAQMTADFPTWQEYLTAIKAIQTRKPSVSNAIYNLAGQRVDANYKGLVIKNGVKMIQK